MKWATWMTTILLVLAVAGSAAGQSNLGEVQIYVFSPLGLPMEGVTVEANGSTYRSDDNGLIDFTHPPGTHDFVLIDPDGVPVGRLEISIRQAQATEVIVTASPDNVMQQAGTDVDAEREAIEREERAELSSDAPRGTLSGSVTARETGEPVVAATIIFRGVDFETTTDENGSFSAEVPVGIYSFSVIHPDFSTQTIDGVEVAEGSETTSDVALTPAAIRLDEVPVFASEEVIVQGGIANLIEDTRNSGVVLNLIGAEQIDRTGDSDAAGALARVTGLTVLDGKFVYVRGMGERYSTSLLNDSRLPSPEPDRRVVPLDLFPASIIESISVQKSYSPEIGGDFGGGAISIRSAGIPDDRYDRRLRTNLGASVGYNQSTSLQTRLVEQVGALDFLGIDDGSRRLPRGIRDEDYVSPGFGGLSEEDVVQLGRSLDNNWQPSERLVPLNYGANASVRDKSNLESGGTFGYNVAALYSNDWGYSEGTLNSYSVGAGNTFVPYNVYGTETSSRDVDVGMLADLVYDNGAGTSVESTTLLLRATDAKFDLLTGYLEDENRDVKVSEQAWTEQMLVNQGLGAELELASLNQSTLDLQYNFSFANRYAPDSRYTYYAEELLGGVPDNDYDEEYSVAWFEQEDDNQRVWTTVNDFVHDAQANVELPVFLFGNAAPDFIDLGLYAMVQTRATNLRRFGYFQPGTLLPDEILDEYYQAEPADVFATEGIGERLVFEEQTYSADNYTGSHIIGAAYATADVLLPLDIRLNAGLRGEYSRQGLTAFTFPVPVQENPVLQTFDLLPAVNFTFPLGDRNQIRAGGSRTINRPDLRELSSSPFFGPPGFGTFQGNPDLTRAVLWNADLRWESYLSLYESISLGGFVKYFQDPIEIVQLYGPALQRFPINIPTAFNLGGELEWALQFRFVSDVLRRVILGLDFASLERERRWRRAIGGVSAVFRDLRTTGNVALINSRVSYESEQVTFRGSTVSLANTETSRPLQGQAPYVINAALGYRNEVSFNQSKPVHTSIFLNYNVAGPFITQLGTENVPDQYQQPFHQLDLVFRQQFGYIFSMSAEIGNILDLPSVQTIGRNPAPGDNIVESGRRGRTFSLSVSFDI